MSGTKSRMHEDVEVESGRPDLRLVVGLGSPHGDDQAGWLAADRLEGQLPPVWQVRKIPIALDLLSLLESQEELVVIDAAAPAGRPGRIRRFAWPCEHFAQGSATSSHGIGLASAFRLAEVLGCLPHSVRVFTVEALACGPMAQVSPPVACAVEQLVASLLEDMPPMEVPCTKRRS